MGFEHSVNVFKRASCGFGVEKEDNWHHEPVEDGPDDIELRPKPCDSERGHEDDTEVDEPIGRNSVRHAYNTVLGAVDLRGVKPRHALPAGAEKEIEEKEKQNGSATKLLLAHREEVCGEGGIEEERYGQPAAALTQCAIHHQSSPAPALNESKANERGEKVRHGVNRGE